MNESKISVRYSKALFESALEKKLLDKVYQDMVLISEITAMDEMKELLSSPVIPPSRKKTVMTVILEKNVEKITLSLIDLLINNGRESYLPSIARVFRNEALKYRGITETDLVTAVQVSESTKNKIIDYIEKTFNTKVELKDSVNEELIGGFILRVNDNYIDASVKNKLRIIRRGLTGGA
jgi:F-type H+-transporting ATPase subunit delta